jgi:4-diphosphocytidyl-2-C-methyl-D-erythritol kinase
MKLVAPAKINLDLKITGRRDDCYHTLSSTMMFTQWGDVMTLTPCDKLLFTVDGPYSHIFNGDLMSVERKSPNLIIRAIWAMADIAKRTPEFHIHLTKNIPSGAGLGGGSSDAAAIINALNTYWKMGLSFDDLCVVGLRLGAELPVCLHAKSAHVSGIGEVIEPANIAPLHLLIVWPDATLMTADVFAEYCVDDNGAGNNDLSLAAMRLCPDIQTILNDLQACDGCVSATMSGSGSACFGIFETEAQAKNALPCFKNAIVTKTV